MKHKIQILLLSFVAIGGLLAPVITASPVYAAECSVLPKSWCESSAASKNVSDSGIMKLLKLGIQLLTAIIGIVAVGVLVYAGIMYSSAGNKADQVSKAKNIITQTVIGLVLYGLMFFAILWLVPGGITG